MGEVSASCLQDAVVVVYNNNGNLLEKSSTAVILSWRRQRLTVVLELLDRSNTDWKIGTIIKSCKWTPYSTFINKRLYSTLRTSLDITCFI